MAEKKPQGAPMNPRIDVSSSPMQSVLKKIFEGALFLNNPEYKEFTAAKLKNETERRAVYITQLVKRYNPSALEPRRLKTNFFDPWMKKNPGEKSFIKLRIDDLRELGNFMRAAARDFHYEEHLKLVDAYFTKYLGEKPQAEAEEATTEQPHHDAAASEASWLVKGSPWYLYARVGEDDTKEARAKYAIGVAELSFASENGGLSATAEFYVKKKDRRHKGEVSFDKYSQYLYIVLASFHSRFKGLLSLKLAEADRPHQTLMLGHFTYHSTTYKHLVTDTVVLQKKEGIDSVVPKGDHYADGEVFEKIDQRIRRFLYPREKNRLSLPKITIAHIGELEAFLEGQEKKSTKASLEHFEESYAVFYKGKDGRIFEDMLEIRMNRERRYYEGKYTHTQHKKTYVGQVFTDSELIAVRLDEYPEERKQDENSILLTFHIPGKRSNLAEVECLPGLLSGLQDSDGLPASYLCLLVRKQGGFPFEGAKDPRVLGYFEQGPYVLTTRAAKFRLDELGGG